jgi:hypothetical protein
MTKKDTPLQARIRAARHTRFGALEELKQDLMEHIDAHMATLHERLDKLEKP